jgi:pyruvate/2-oxoglutarate dehydrogenase complex dihydrolipoamide acyltransferase (E2) component
MSASDRVAVDTEPLWPGEVTDDAGLVINWFVAEGARVTEGQRLCEVQVEKVDVDVPSPADGTLVEVVYGEDEEFQRGQALAYVRPG